MTTYLAERSKVLDWIRALGAETETFFPQPVGAGSFEFRKVRPFSELRLEKGTAGTPREEFRASSNIVPPGKKLSPPKEILFRFERDESGNVEIQPVFESKQQILAGVRPCDLRAIYLMDKVNRKGPADPNYLTRRKGTLIIGHDCLQPCDEKCFCDAVGSLSWREGADVFLSPLEEEILIECLTQEGEELAKKGQFEICEDVESKKEWIEEHRAKPFGRQFNASLETITRVISEQWESEVWKKHVERCFSCGTCNLVCPTCYCFDVKDDLNVEDPSTGIRYRTWDGCMLPDFAEVAGNHNFRPEPEARQRHRVKRKFEYLPTDMGEVSYCVGCGRCSRQCTVDIDIYEIVNDLLETAEAN